MWYIDPEAATFKGGTHVTAERTPDEEFDEGRHVTRAEVSTSVSTLGVLLESGVGLLQ